MSDNPFLNTLDAQSTPQPLSAPTAPKPGKSGEVNPFLSTLDAVEQNSATAGRLSVRNASGVNADQYAEGKRLSTDTVSADVAARNLEEMRRQAAMREYDTISKYSPTLAESLKKPDFAKLSNDDWATLQETEKLLKRAPKPEQTLFDEVSRHVFGNIRSLGAGLLTDFNAAAWGIAEGGAKFVGADQVGGFFGEQRKGQEAMGKRIQGEYGKDGLVEGGVSSGFRSFGGMIPATVASLLTGNPQFMLGMGAATSGGQAVGKGLDKGLSPGKALLYGAEDATAEYATEMIPVARLFKDLKVGTPFHKLLGMQIATEVPTELAATTWQNFNEWANVNPDKSFQDYLDNLGPDLAQTVVATITQTVLSAGMAKGVQRLAQDPQKAQAAAEQAKALQELAELSKASKLRERDPQSFAEFVDAAAADGPVQNLYVDAQALHEVLGEEGMQTLMQSSPAVAAQAVEAIQTGGDIVIPLGEYAATIAPTDANAVLMPHLRTSAEALSMEDAKTYLQDRVKEFEEKSEKVLAQKEFDGAFKESAATVEKELLAQLKNTNRFTDDVNTSYAKLMGAFYTVQAARLGITPEEMYVKYPLLIQAEGVTKGNVMDQTPARRAAKELLGSIGEVPAEAALTDLERTFAAPIIEPMLRAAAVNKPSFDAKVRNIAERGGRKAKFADVKSLDRAALKLVREYGDSPEKLMDLLRATVVVPSEAEAYKALEDIRSEFGIVREKDFYKKPTEQGYKGLLVNVRLPDGSVGEIQVLTPEMLEAKDEIAHDLYKVDRALQAGDPRIAALLEAQRAVYEEASVLNSASLKGIPKAETLARLEKGLDPLLSTATQEPSGSRATATSSTSKNLVPGGKVGESTEGTLAQAKNTVNVDGVDRPTVNSNGQPLAATEESLVAFWRWFGDSKVVDEEGRPLVVYHGTNKRFTRFETGKNTYEGAAFFTTEPGVAEGFIEWNEEAGAPPGYVMPVYLRVENPKTLDAADAMGENEGHSFDAMREAVADARAEKHDGMLLKDVPDMEMVADQWAVFSPRQIKSAIGNRGTFDPDSPNILHQAANVKPGADLIIQHNVTAENLLHALRMGGFPVPSLAVSKANDSLVNFGEITLIGPSEMANPRGYARTRVYGADIYSPRYPDISYKLGTPELKKLNALLAPYREGDERELYGSEVSNVRDLENIRAFKRYAEDKFKSDTGRVDYREAGTTILREIGAPERIFTGYDYNGNRRYKAHTLENVIRMLKKELRGGESSGNIYGIGQLRSQFAPQFRSIKSIQKERGRIVTDEQFEAVKKEVESEFFELVEALGPHYKHKVEPFRFTDTVMYLIGDTVKYGVAHAAKENQFNELPEDVRADLWKFTTRLRNMPTEYFEAKILRGVGIEEFTAAVVPEGTKPEVIDALKSRGLKVETYEKGNEADRKKVVAATAAEQPNVLFQEPTKAEPFYSALAKNIADAKMKAAPAQGWKDYLKSLVAKGQVKRDEIEWSGIEDWLDTAEGKVTKEAVTAFLQQNGVKVTERMLGGDGAARFEVTSFGEWQDDEPGKDYFEETARDFYLDDIKQDMARDQDIPVEEVDEEEAMAAAVQRAEHSYYDDPDRAQYREIEVEVNGVEYTVVDTASHGERDVFVEHSESLDQALQGGQSIDLPQTRRGPDNAQIEHAIRSWFADKLGVDFDEDAQAPFEDYTLPGGENYRVLLLTLPKTATAREELGGAPAEISREAAADQLGMHAEDVAEASSTILMYPSGAYITKKADGNYHVIVFNEETVTADLKEAENFLAQKFAPEIGSDKAFRSSHFDEPNILAHVRFKDRVDADGKKVLFVEEFQSDWAQKGKKEGFKHAPLTEAEKAEMKRFASLPDSELTADDNARWSELTERNQNESRVPPAPFVQKTEQWLTLAMKRTIRYAAEHGYDRIAWTTGEQQADRYSLSKSVESIGWEDAGGRGSLGLGKAAESEGSKRVGIDLIGRNGFVLLVDASGNVLDSNQRGDQLVGKKLEDVIGKAASEKIMASTEGRLAGDGLKIGGEGMLAFYDKIVPNVANDVLKKLGGGRVGAINLGKPSKAESGWSFEENEGGLWDVLDPNGGLVEVANSEHDAHQAIENFSRGQQISASQFKEGPASQPGFDITPDMRDKAMQGLPLFQGQGGNRGQIAFGDDIKNRPSVLTLLENADLSTFLHEMGHFQLEVLADIASQPDAPREIKEDMQRLLDWFGIPTLENWRDMKLEDKRPYHERFARGFEAYLFEGKSPAPELNGIFARFRAWLINVYKNVIAALDEPGRVNLSDEVRGVMDRLIATNEQILEAEAQRNMEPLFTEKPEDVTDADWQAYTRLNTESTQEAANELQSRSIRDMKWLANARSGTLKRLQKAAAARRKQVEAEVTAEVREQPVYAAQRFLRYGELPEAARTNADKRLLDSIAGAPTKLSIPVMKEMYGEGPAAPWRYLPVGKNGIAAVDGVHPDIIANLFGFTSGDHLVRAILEAQPEAEVIEGMTDQRMLERYGDLSSPQALERATAEALHNEARARFAATEYKFAAKVKTPVRVLSKAAKEFAAKSIAQKKVKDVKPSQYETAEARATRAAEKLRGKADAEFVMEVRNKLLNNALAGEAHRTVDEVEKGVRYLKKVGDSETIDSEYRDQINALLERFNLKTLTGKELERHQSLLEWIDSQPEDNGPVIDPRLVNEANRKPYQEMTVEEFRGLVDSVKNIEHLGRLKHKLLTAKDERDFKKRVDEAATSIIENAKKVIPFKRKDGTWTEAVKEQAVNFFVEHRKFSAMIREMDGYKDGGVLWELLSRPMNAAGAREAVMREEATMRLTALFAPLQKDGGFKGKKKIDEIGGSLTREQRIMVALNAGNEGNLQRLMDGEHWSRVQVQAIIDKLTKEEMDFVQSIWDFNDSYRREIGEQQRRLTGVEPEWVEPTPIFTRHGVYRGGYLPVKYDTTRSTRALSDEAAAGIMDQWRGARGVAKARDSFTRERSEKVVDRAVRLDFGVITQHVTEVTHRLAWQEFLFDANRLLRAKPIDAAIREHYGPEALKAMRDTITDIAIGDQPAQAGFERCVDYLRTGTSIAYLGWRVTTSLLQPLGLTQSIVRIGAKHVGRGLSEWIGDAVRMENTAKRIYDKSEMMRLRGKTMQREISEIRNMVNDRNSAIEASYFYLIQKMQLVADIPTWLGQYNKGIEAGETEERAVALADQAVLDAQGGGQIKDLAAIQRGSTYKKVFTPFYSFFNTTYQLTREAVGKTDFKNPLSIGILAVDFLLLYSVPAALSTLMKAALSGGDDEDKLLRKLAADQLTYLFGTMVGLREFGGALTAAVGLNAAYSGPATTRLFAEMVALSKQIQQGEMDENLLKAANSVGGILFHYPAGQVNATADGIYSLVTGKTENPGALLVGSKEK